VVIIKSDIIGELKKY